MNSLRATKKRALVKATLSLITKKGSAKSAKKRSTHVGDQHLINYVLNADKGEKKTEAGIKLWFEQHIKGHQTEEGNGKGTPDGYTPGWLLLELKGKQQDWIEGLFQGLSRKDLSYKLLVVAAHKRLLVFPSPSDPPMNWDDTKKAEWLSLAKQTQEKKGSASAIGKEMAVGFRKKGHLLNRFSIFSWSPDSDEQLFKTSQDEDEAIDSFKKIVTSFDPSKARIQITPKNFSDILRSLVPFFDQSLEKKFEVVHGFFRCLSFWNQGHRPICSDDPAQQDKVFIGAGHFESLLPEAREDFIRAISRYEVLNPDKARFYAHYDLAIDAVDPEYRANHGIYFTNEYLARIAITLSEQHLGSIGDKYIVFDPACGSGNLVTSWNHHLDLRHKVVSEISPVLLKAFELRFQGKSSERKKGFTIIPKTSTGDGLNFVNQPASEYLEKINNELETAGHKLNKPLAIICNPPYRNQKNIKNEFYKYDVHESLVKIAGKDASNELFVAFLAQITEICRLAEENELPDKSVVLLFTKSVWLTDKPSYRGISAHFLKTFQEKMGFIVDSREFFDVKQSWPLLVSLWEYQADAELDPKRELKFENYLKLERKMLKDLAGDKNGDFDDLSGWSNDDIFRAKLKKLLKSVTGSSITFNKKLNKLKDNIPPQAGEGNGEISADLIEMDAILGGLCFATPKQESERISKFEKRVLPLYRKNKELEKQNKKRKKLPSFKVQGHPTGTAIGFTEAKQPFRTNKSFRNDGTNLFFMMDTRFMKMKTSQCFSGIPTTRGHIINSLGEKEKNLIIGYAMAQSLYNCYPVQFDQFDMWLPEGTESQRNELYALAVAFLYLSNGCIECEVPVDVPYEGGPRVFVTNPLAPNKGTFWETKLKSSADFSASEIAEKAVSLMNSFYKEWKKWINDNPNFKAKAGLPIHEHKPNRQPLDGWGVFQIDHELKLMPKEEKIHALNNQRKLTLKGIRERIANLVSEMNYWDV